MMPCSTSGEKEIARRLSEVLPGVNFVRSIEKIRSMLKIMSDINYDERRAAELFARFVKNNTWSCPTLTVTHGLMFCDEEHLANDPRLKYMPPYAQDGLNPKNNAFAALATGEWRAEVRKLCEKHLAIVGVMRNAGVGILAGTDTWMPGLDLQDELALFVQAGLSPMEALQTATYNAAKFLGKLDSMGTIEQGKMADLVLLDANPLQDIRNTRRINTVVAGGRVFDKTARQKMLIQVEEQVKVDHIHQAASNGEIEQVKLLISEVADVNVKNKEGLTLLHWAARDGHKEIVELLLAHGAEVNIGGAKYNRTAAEFAMNRNHTEIFQLLVSKGADISPLHFAIYMNDEAKARGLIDGGADVNNRTPQGTTPLNLAIHRGLTDIAELLIARDVDVNANHYWGWTPLHGAAEKGYKDIVELLISEGANVNARDDADRTPLWYAKDEGNAEIVELLRKHGAKE